MEDTQLGRTLYNEAMQTAKENATGRKEEERRILHAFFEWLLPKTCGNRIAKGPQARGSDGRSCVYDDFFKLFQGNGMMEWQAFEEFMWDTQFASNSHKIFQMLDLTGSGCIKSQTVLQVRREFERSMDARQSDLSYLKQRFNMVYGSLARAWRAILDPSPGRGYCCHSKFCEACRAVGFVGDLKETWAELTGDRGAREGRSLFLRDLDREADKLMNRLVDILKRGTKTPRDGWNAIMRAHGGGGGLNLPTFRKICGGFGFTDGEAEKLFHCLQAAEDREFGRIRREQWKFLALWERGPPQYDSMMRRAHKDLKREQKRDWAAKSNASEDSFDSTAVPDRKAFLKSAWHVVPKDKPEPETISFELEMDEGEYQEYMRRLRKASGFLGGDTMPKKLQSR